MLRRLAPLALVLGLPSLASAHVLMTSPTPRNQSDGLKTGPCGNVAATDAPATLMAGATITMSWLETVDHPGYYRVAYSPPGDGGFEEGILLDAIADIDCVDAPCSYTAEVTLPAEPCQGCALQLIQFMGTAAPYSPYFSCADVTLMAPDPVGGDAGVGEPGPGDDDGGSPGVTGGCSTGGSGTPGFALGIALGWLAIRRR
ncbi:MAG TPA: SCE4755 family polysaccharide monooxygenase-like protein [Kofleriaceae bacterium]|nr:SCE4755 family polysaccharide monooxygenase-like protein [Kofleriaceae bacterium]